MRIASLVLRVGFALTLSEAGTLSAQTPAVVDVGIRVGGAVTDSFHFLRPCCGPASISSLAGTYVFSPEKLHSTAGASVSLLLFDRAEVRFEAVRRRFGYQVQWDLRDNVSSQHSLETTHGHFWQYPLLATFGPGQGMTRPFIGGGFDLGGTKTFSTESQTTFTTTLLGPTPVTTTSTRRVSGSTRLSTAYYIIGGVDGRVSIFSIRPEIRYIRFPGTNSFSSGTLLKPNQFEFLIGLSVHPFQRSPKK